MARSARVKADGVAHYHVVSRVANKAFLFGDAKRKGRILDFLRRSAEFSGVDVVTYALMDNHIHLCVRVPERARWCAAWACCTGRAAARRLSATSRSFNAKGVLTRRRPYLSGIVGGWGT